MENQILPTQIPTLLELQRWMKWAITEPRGIKCAFSDPIPSVEQFGEYYVKRFSEPSPTCRNLIEFQCESFNAQDRLNVYAEGYFIRLYDQFAKETYILTCGILGEDSFKKLVAEYFVLYPSVYWNIEETGKCFYEFISNHNILNQYPFLSELVSFEWTIVCIFYKNNQPPISSEQLSKVTQWDGVKFVFSEAMKIFSTEWSIYSLWENRIHISSHSQCEKIPLQHMLLFRNRDMEIEIESISYLQYKILNKLIANYTLSETLESVCEENTENVLREVQNCFQHWMSKGLIICLI